MEWEMLAQLGLGVALRFFKALGKPLEEITYDDLKNFRSFDQALAEEEKKAKAGR